MNLEELERRLRDWDNTTPERNRLDMAEAADLIAKLRALEPVIPKSELVSGQGTFGPLYSLEGIK